MRDMQGPVIIRIYSGAKDHFMIRFWEWWSAGFLMLAAWVFLKIPEAYQTSDAYRYISSFIGSQSWGLILLIVACLRVVALILNGTFDPFRRYSPGVRSLTALFSAWSWALIFMSLFQENENYLGKVAYAALTVADIFLFITVADEAAEVEREYRHNKQESTGETEQPPNSSVDDDGRNN